MQDRKGVQGTHLEQKELDIQHCAMLQGLQQIWSGVI